MRYEVFDWNNRLIQLTMVIKLQQMQRNGLPKAIYDYLEEYLKEDLWTDKVPVSLHEAVNDIMSIDVKDIVVFLSRKAVIDGSRLHLEDFADIIGRKES